MNGINLVLDTNILIYHLQDRDPRIFSIIEEYEVAVSIISKIELLGFHAISTVEEDQIIRFLKVIQIVDVHDEISEIAINLRKQYKIKTPDSIVAATALFYEVPVMTADSNFDRIDQ